MKKIKLSKQEKILLAIHKKSRGSKRKMKFEEVVVAVFKMFPEDFHLKGYKQYPDADIVRRNLYKFKELGILNVGNMIFSLTEKGCDQGERIEKKTKRKKIYSSEKFDRYVEKEIRRVSSLNSLSEFKKGDENILDTDFFEYLGVSVKCSRIEFKSRLETMSEVTKKVKSDKNYKDISKFHEFMINEFSGIINYKLNKKNE